METLCGQSPLQWTIWLLIIFHISLTLGGSQATDIEALLSLRNSISNWNDYASRNGIGGWVPEVPVCTGWTGVTCNDQGRVLTVRLACDPCTVKASGTLPPLLSTMDALVALDLRNNDFRGQLPVEWSSVGQFAALQTLYLGNNSLTGPVPWRGQAFPSLQLIRLDGNQLSGQWPDDLILPSLTVFRGYSNLFSGPLSPNLLNNWPKILILSFQQNNFTDGLPTQWARSTTGGTSLQELYLQNNQLSSGLPIEWSQPGSFPSLNFLNLDNNPIGGTLPSQWGYSGSFPKLKNLAFGDTNLTGELPPTWATVGAFASIEVIDLGGNNIGGNVDAWSNFVSLSRLIVRPGNPDLCTYPNVELPFQLCDRADPSCISNVPQLKSCSSPTAEPQAAAPSPPSSSSSDNGSSFPVVAVAVPVGVVVASAVILGIGLLVWRRKAKRSRELAGAEKRRSAPQEHPFDTWEGQQALTSPFAPTAFSSVNAAAVAPTGRASDETTITTTANVSASTTRSSDSVVSRCARIRTRSFKLPRDASSVAVPPPSIAVSLPTMPAPFSGSPAASPSQDRKAAPVVEMQPLSVLLAKERSAIESHGGSESALGFGSRSPPSSVRLSSEIQQGSPQGSIDTAAGETMAFSDWEIRPNELQFMHKPDESEWELGRGGFGRVVKALKNGVQPVAVKILERTGDLKGKSTDAIYKEIAILRACRDANIVQFQGAYLGEDQTLLVTEYMEGGDLMANIAAGRVTWWRRGRKIAIDVAKGLCFLHARRIVHFDLKSPNILLARDGTAKIADVGMATFLARDYVTGIVGTFAWSAPEMLWGAKCSEKADIYSYGIILYEICTGEKPIRGQLRDVAVPEECPEEVRALILECLDTRPSRRPTAQQLVERLLQIKAQPPPTASPGSLSVERKPSSPVPSVRSSMEDTQLPTPVSPTSRTSSGTAAIQGRFSRGST